MARTAKSDEIFFHIGSQTTSRLDMMDLKILWTFRIVGIASHRGGVLAGKAAIGIRSKRSLGCLEIG